MSSSGPWSVKGIDPKAREMAKDLARRSGMTLGEWLNQMIIDGEALDGLDDDYSPRPDARRAPRRPAPQRAAPRAIYRDFDDEVSTLDVSRVTRALDAFSARLEAAEHRSTLAISGIDQSVMGVLSRLEGLERERNAVGAHFEGAVEDLRADQAKLADRLRRMEQDDAPRTEAMKALETALGRVAGQIYEAESRARGGLTEVRQDLSGIARRVDRLDAETSIDPNSATARIVETVVARIAERLDQAEGRTSAAIQALETSFSGLDARLGAAESRLDVEAGGARFERLAADLQEKVEAGRAELAERLRAAAEGRVDRLEGALHDLTGQVEAAERRSAQAIDRMGREVVRIAQGLGQRVAAVESHSAKVGAEVTKIADVVEARMKSAETAQTEALEKLGAEIGRIAERMAERISASERRAAAAIDEVGDQIAKVTDKINQRYDRSSSELAERIRQSEERTAKLLDEARLTVDRQLGDPRRKADPEAAVEAPPMQAARLETSAIEVGRAYEAAVEAPAVLDFDEDDFDAGFAAEDDFSPSSFARSDISAAPHIPPAPPIAPVDFDLHDEDDPVSDDPFALPIEALADEPEDLEAEAPPARFEEPALDADPVDEDVFAPPASAGRNASTRELIEAARAAARQAAASESRGRRGRGPAALGAAPVPPADEVKGGLAALFGKKKKKKEAGTVLRTTLLASGTAATLTLSAVGYGMLMKAGDTETAEPAPTAPTAAAAPVETPQANDADLLAAALVPEPESANAAAPADAAVQEAITSANAQPPAQAAGSAAVRPAAPRPAARPAPVAEAKPAAKPVAAASVPGTDADVRQIYGLAVQQIERGDAKGMDVLRRAAVQGYAPAQFYLAKLYEVGSAGLKKDMVEARRWTEKAAAGGDAKAMHNLGLYYFEGAGGAKNTVQAASWFRKAADAGLKDSQYNLARLYEQGYGVPQNPAEAYKWYLIAAVGGDQEAKASAERLRAQLTPDLQQVAQRSAAAFRPQSTALAQR